MKVSAAINDLLFRLIDSVLGGGKTCPRKVKQKEGTGKGAHGEPEKWKGRKRGRAGRKNNDVIGLTCNNCIPPRSYRSPNTGLRGDLTTEPVAVELCCPSCDFDGGCQY